jgi:RND family efflux transporter MFP subunit
VQKSDLSFRVAENISSINFKNGDRVMKGQVIATLNNFTLVNQLKQSKEEYERARLMLQDLLIGQGYSLSDSASVPKSTFMAARIKSGFDKALNALEMAKYNLEQTSIKAPFNGIIANISLKQHNTPVVGERFCTIIDNSFFEAEFNVLENELNSLSKGQQVKVKPYALNNLEIEGIISQINPVVDKNGLVAVKAVCPNKNNLLTEGMNVKIIILDKVKAQLVIPKPALVLRSEKQVVFTYSNGLAKWNYVKTSSENSDSYSIAEGLKPGDTVIVEGALNLAHDSRVNVVK